MNIVTVDARHLTIEQKDSILASLQGPHPFLAQWIPTRAGWYIEPHPTLLEHSQLGWLVAIALLLIPAIIAVWGANSFATIADPIVQSAIAPTIKPLSQLPIGLREILIGQYGLITMSPLLFIWAMPTVILYALFLGVYKASGLIERITIALNPLLRPLGLSGRDLVRVIMGMGCNVPAVISPRACSSCSRGTCISAIAFGSACSYQFGATLGVFSIEGRTFLEFPHWSVIWREAQSTIEQFLFNAIPIFLAIVVIASILNGLGAIAALASIINPLMGSQAIAAIVFSLLLA